MIVVHNFCIRSEQLFRHSRTMTTADKLLITLLVVHEYYHSKPEESDNSGVVVIVIHYDAYTSTRTHSGSTHDDVFVSPSNDVMMNYREQVNN